MNIEIYVFGILLGVGLTAVIWYTISSLCGSRKRFEEFEKAYKSLEPEPAPLRYDGSRALVRYDWMERPVTPLVATENENIERERLLRSIDI